MSIPVVMGDESTQLANIALVNYVIGNGQFTVQLAEQRMISGIELPPNLPEGTTEIIFELGQYALTLRAARQLLDSLVVAVRAYEATIGSPLPTIDQFIARAAMTTLHGSPRAASRKDTP